MAMSKELATRWAKAQQLVAEGAVRCAMTLDDGSLSISVKGNNGNYDAHIEFANGKLSNAECNCADFINNRDDFRKGKPGNWPTLHGLLVCKHVLAAATWVKDFDSKVQATGKFFLVENNVTFLYRVKDTDAVREMEKVMARLVLDMDRAVQVFDAFYTEAEMNIIVGMKPEWKARFNAIGEEHTRRMRLTNPCYCKWSEVPEWFVEHPSYDGMRPGENEEAEVQGLYQSLGCEL